MQTKVGENMNINFENPLIKKKTICPGRKYIPLTPGTRVKFHFQTHKATDGTLIDDSILMNKPMEMVLGKQFKLEVWEVIIQKMALDEVARFTVDKSLVAQYPFIAKTLRDIGKYPDERRHCCGMTLQSEGIGYKDLDDLFANPCDLIFTMNLFLIELPEQYEKERWQMSDKEKLKKAGVLREKGNKFYRDQQFLEAEQCYHEAVGLIEQLMLKEKPGDTDWQELATIKIPLLLNFSQCRLLAGDYYPVIEHCTEVLMIDPCNVKALFRRAKAHFGAWNPKQARTDFLSAVNMDGSLRNVVAKELKAIDEQERLRDMQDKMRLQKLF